MHSPESVRLDKWLWAVRLYKTRSMATEACNAGKIHIGEQALKPARNVHVGEIITVACADIKKTVKVLALLDKRVGAKLVPQFSEDLTPASEYEKQRLNNLPGPGFRPPGAGRPTKKERRTLNEFLK
ncbi:MAG: RNA-binding protein [Verrucomicrobiales bacterium]|nr:RNA-binding protein [Verrucomicrobiales bacterium]